MAAATAEVVSLGRSLATTSTRCPASSRRTAQDSPTTPAPTTMIRISRPAGVASGAGPAGRGRVVVHATLLARDVLLDVLEVVLVAGDDREQVAHRGDLLDLLLDEPLHELLGGEVGLLAGGPEQAADLVGHPLLLVEGERHRRDQVAERVPRRLDARNDHVAVGVEEVLDH